MATKKQIAAVAAAKKEVKKQLEITKAQAATMVKNLPSEDVGFQNAAANAAKPSTKTMTIAEVKRLEQIAVDAQKRAIAAANATPGIAPQTTTTTSNKTIDQIVAEANKPSTTTTTTTPTSTPTSTTTPTFTDRANKPKDIPGKQWKWISLPAKDSPTRGEWRSITKDQFYGAGPVAPGTPGAAGAGQTPTPTPVGLDQATQNLITSLQQQIASLTAAQNNTATADAAAKDAARQDAIAVLTDRFAKFGLSSLVSKIKELAITGASEATISLQLQETPEYKQRFSANDLRIKKGLTVLSPAEYLANEDRYRQALRAYGLKQFDNDAYVSQFIANDVSPTELSNRIVTAVQRVQNADPAVAKQLKDYYNIGQTDLVAYVLDPEQQFQKIERQVAAAEIGVAAGRQGLQAGVGVAEQLAAQGVTQAEAQKGYATIADILPTAEKLSGIYGTTLEGYNQASAEQEVFNFLASAQRAREKLKATEIAQFSGSTGTGKASLANKTTAGQI